MCCFGNRENTNQMTALAMVMGRVKGGAYNKPFGFNLSLLARKILFILLLIVYVSIILN